MRSRAAACGLAALLSLSAASASTRADSGDGRSYVAIKQVGSGDKEGSGSQALVFGRRGERERILLVSKYNEDHRRNLTNIDSPLFSLDGGFVYFSTSDSSPNRSAVQQFDLRKRTVRFVTGGWALSVIRTGPYRGYLLVQKHKYHDRPQGGSYNPVFVVRPNGDSQFMVPGSDTEEGEVAVKPWLAKQGWRAW